MRIVTGFSDSFEEPDKKSPHPLTDYFQALDALEHNHEVAITCFARAAKKTLHNKLGGATLGKSSDDELGGLPLWVTENSVAFNLKEKAAYASGWDIIKQSWAESLFDLVEAVATTIQTNSKGRGDLILVDALKIRMMEVGADLYRFTVKQMWTVKKDG